MPSTRPRPRVGHRQCVSAARVYAAARQDHLQAERDRVLAALVVAAAVVREALPAATHLRAVPTGSTWAVDAIDTTGGTLTLAGDDPALAFAKVELEPLLQDLTGPAALSIWQEYSDPDIDGLLSVSIDEVLYVNQAWLHG